MLEPTAIVPFIPGGSDFARSRELFRELGFLELWDGGRYIGFRSGSVQFILQDFDLPAFAEQLMIQLIVPNLEEWWQTVQSRNLLEWFSGFRINPPKDFPWGREVHFIDLAGVCWHVRQS